jgi:hypothetical protein
MNGRFMITGLLGSLLVAGAAAAPAAEEQKPATQDKAAAAAAPAEPPAEPEPAKLSPEKLDSLVGPIALYPDPLLIQVLIASTYPLEIVEADRWRRQHKDLKDDALIKALEEEDWDPSVEGLTQFPDLLKRMSENLDWTKDIGDAFLSQQKDVLDAVQRMRKLAQQAGSLQTTKEQTVTKEVVNNKETIIIEPAQPETVYVPQYPPQAYGAAAPPPAYPASYGYPAAYPMGYTGTDMMMTSMLSFGVGMGVGALISGGCDWDDHDVYYGNGGGGGNKNNSNNNININREKNVDRGDRTVNRGDRGDRGDRGGRGGGQKWQHNPEHRRNVGYRDPGTAKRFEGQNPQASQRREARDQARGYDGGARGQRPGSPSQRPSASQRPAASQRPSASQRPATSRPGGGDGGRGGGGGRQTARPTSASAGGRNVAFGGSGNAGSTRAASQRGASSRGGQSWAGSGGGSRGGGYGGGGGRGGGGGGRGGGGGGRGGGGGGRGGGGGGRRR